jgi:hypothetical protein
MTKTININNTYNKLYTLKQHAVKMHRIEMIKQRVFGLSILLLCATIVMAASGGRLPEGGNITAVLLFAPIGVYVLFTKEYIM